MADDPYVISINKFGSEARREVEQPARGEVVGGSKVHWRLGGGEAHWQLGTGRSGLTRPRGQRNQPGAAVVEARGNLAAVVVVHQQRPCLRSFPGVGQLG